MNLKRLFLYLLIGSVAFSAVVGIGVILLGDFLGNLWNVRVLMTTLTVTITSILGLACGAYYETGRGRTLPIAGMVLSIVAALMTFLIIWNILDEHTNFIKATATVTLLALSASHLSLLSLARLDQRFAWSLIVVFVLICGLDGILLFLMWFEPDGEGVIVFRTIGILSILIASITVVTPVFHKLSRDQSKTELESINDEIEQLKARLSELETKKAELTQ